MAVPGQRLNAQVENWLSKLIDLSRRNRLLYFRESKRMTLQVMAPSAGKLLDRVVGNGRPHRFWVPPPSSDRYVPRRGETEDDTPDEDVARQMGLVCHSERPRYALETSQLNWRELATTLKRMSSRAELDLAERGVRILHLAFGMLEWRDEETQEPVRSPIVMVPVELGRESRKDPWELGVCDEDIVLNPVLAVKLQRDFKLELPAIPTDWKDASLDGYLGTVRAAVADTVWRATDEAWLGLFSFHKLPMYQDLSSNRARLGTHAIAARLAGEPTDRDPQTEPVVDAGTLDPNLHPRDSLLVVDADSSQLAAIETVKLGTSLVLHGPPGTGKSQTITNVIAEMLARGKSVLFVSEKMAALEVVYGRIAEAGLDHLCLELHSHKASRKAVVEALHKAMTERVTATGGLSADDLDRLFERRERLNAYVAGLHAVRQPLGRCVFDVLGELVELRSAALRPIDEAWVTALDGERYDWLGQVAARLTGMWEPVVEGRRFPWYGFQPDRLGDRLMEPLASQVTAAEECILQAEAAAADLASGIAMDAPGSLAEARLVPKVATLCADRPGVERSWLSDPESRPLPDTLREARSRHEEAASRRAALAERQGDDFVAEAGVEHRGALDALCQVLANRLGLFTVEGRFATDTPVAHVITASEWVVGLRDRAASIADATRELASLMGLRNQTVTLRRARDLVRLSAMCTLTTKPLRQWLTAERVDDVVAWFAELTRLMGEWRDAVAMALEGLDPSVFELDVRALSGRYEAEYATASAFLRPQFWRDSRELRAYSKRKLSRAEARTLVGHAARAETLRARCDEIGPVVLGDY